MADIVISCSGAKHITKKIAKKLKVSYSELSVNKFPDNEFNINFPKSVKGKNVFLIQSFYGNINEKIVETLFAGYTAKDLGAKKVNLVALYFPYIRQDRRFHPGECVSGKVIFKMFSVFDNISIVEPHLHRIKNIKGFSSKAKRIAVSEDIALYLKNKNIKNAVFIGPDIESKQWIAHVTKFLGKKPLVLRKERFAARKVRVKIHGKYDIKGKDIIIIDDIISTGHTMLETIKLIKKLKAKRIYCIAIHGIFADNALKKLRKYAKVITCNTIPNPVTKINIANTIAKSLK